MSSSTYKRRKEDESTFGFGRYPKRHCNGYSRDYHSLSVTAFKSYPSSSTSRHHNGGNRHADANLYHFSLSSELYGGGRHSGSNSTTTNTRYSNCSTTSNATRRKRRFAGGDEGKCEEESSGPSTKVPRRDESLNSKKVSVVSAYCYF